MHAGRSWARGWCAGCARSGFLLSPSATCNEHWFGGAMLARLNTFIRSTCSRHFSTPAYPDFTQKVIIGAEPGRASGGAGYLNLTRVRFPPSFRYQFVHRRGNFNARFLAIFAFVLRHAHNGGGTKRLNLLLSEADHLERDNTRDRRSCTHALQKYPAEHHDSGVVATETRSKMPRQTSRARGTTGANPKEKEERSWKVRTIFP
jgi:hypothetical protein